MAYQPRLKVLYEENARPQLSEQFGYENIWEVPRPQKICVSMAISEATDNFVNVQTRMGKLSGLDIFN